MVDGGSHDPERSDHWAGILAGEDRGLQAFGRFLRKVPSPPRCKLCQAPFSGPFAPFLRLAGFRRWHLNQQLCRWCISDLDKHPGGAEIPVSLLYVDVRGSTSLAEQMSTRDFTTALNRYLSVVATAIDEELGVIDHMAGDGVMALWIPGFVGPEHPLRAVAAGRRIATDLVTDPDGRALPAGVGVHTGEAYVGVIGEAGSKDFTVVGDTANTVARLSSVAASGEMVMSAAIAAAAHVETSGLERRVLELKGKARPVSTWVWKVGSATEAAS